jgi:hypothetical protein
MLDLFEVPHINARKQGTVHIKTSIAILEF